MTDAEYLKLRTVLKRIEAKVDLLIYNKRSTEAVGREVNDSIFKSESEILGPKKRRAYPYPLSPSGKKD